MGDSISRGCAALLPEVASDVLVALDDASVHCKFYKSPVARCTFFKLNATCPAVAGKSEICLDGPWKADGVCAQFDSDSP